MTTQSNNKSTDTTSALEIARDLIKNHPSKGVQQRAMLIELRLVQDQDVDPKVLEEMRAIHKGVDPAAIDAENNS